MRIRRADRAIGRLVDRAGRVQVVAGRAGGALREHRSALVEERLGRLVAADLAPDMVELPGHAEKGNTERLDVAGADREMLVTPEGGRQGFDLKVRKVLEDVAAAAADVTEIEEERHLGVVPAHGAADSLEEIDLRRLGELQAVIRIGPVETLRLHLGLRPG